MVALYVLTAFSRKISNHILSVKCVANQLAMVLDYVAGVQTTFVPVITVRMASDSIYWGSVSSVRDK